MKYMMAHFKSCKKILISVESERAGLEMKVPEGLKYGFVKRYVSLSTAKTVKYVNEEGGMRRH